MDEKADAGGIRLLGASLSREFVEDVAAELRPIFGHVESGVLAQFSTEPPTWLQVFVQPAVWKAVLGVAATMYFKRVAEGLGDLTVDGVRALGRMAKVLARAKRGAGSITPVLDRGKERLSVFHQLQASDEEGIAREIAEFVVRMDGTERAAAALLDAGFMPDRGFWMELTEGGFVLTWWQSSKVPLTRRFTINGDPIAG